MSTRTLNPTKSSRVPRLRRWLSSPLFLLALTAGLSAFVIQSGELGTADTTVES